MANRDSVFGLRPAIGIYKKHMEFLFPIDSSSGTATFIGDIVTANAAGSVRPAAANDNTSVAGVVIALYDSNKIPCGAWGSSVSTKQLTASTAGYALVALATAGAIFVAQAQTGQTPAATSLFATTDHVAGTGSSTTGLSGHELNMSDLNTGGQLIILGLYDEPGNTWGEHVKLYVAFNESIFMGSGKVVGV